MRKNSLFINIKNKTFSVFFFILFKSLVFIVPLLLVNVLTPEQFVLIDSSIAISNVLVIVVSVGVTSAIPLYLIKDKNKTGFSCIIHHSIFVFILLIIAGGAFICLGFDSKYILVSFISATLVFSRVLSVYSKSVGQPVASSFFESFLYLGLLSFFLSYFFYEFVSDSFILFTFFFISIIMLFFFFFEKSIKSAVLIFPQDGKKIKNHLELYKYSINTLFVSVLIILSVTFVRIVGDGAISDGEYIAYSILFKYYSVSVIIFQMIVTYKFSSIYSSDSRLLDRYLITIVLLLLFFDTLLILFYPVFSPFIFSYEVLENASLDKPLHLLIVCSQLLWVMSAFLENIVNRERAMSCFIKIFFPSLSLILLFSFFIYNEGLKNLILVHLLILSFVVGGQLYSLSSMGVRLKGANLILCFCIIFGVYQCV